MDIRGEMIRVEDLKSRKVDKENQDVVRPLIKHKKGIGGFMKFRVAYVPMDEFWIVFRENYICEDKLTEDEAFRVAHFHNTREWLSAKVEKEVTDRQVVSAVLNYDEIYNHFPRKIGKKVGIARLKAKVKSIEKFNLLLEAVKHYAAYCERESIDEKFIKHFSTWVNVWEDWIPLDTKVSSIPQLSFDDITKKTQL